MKRNRRPATDMQCQSAYSFHSLTLSKGLWGGLVSGFFFLIVNDLLQ